MGEIGEGREKMDSPKSTVTRRLPPDEPTQPLVPRSRFTRLRKWFTTRPGRIALLSGTFLVGLLAGILAVLLYAFTISFDSQPINAPTSSQPTSIIAQVSSTFISQLVGKNLQSAGLPGKVQNVHVNLAHNSPITVTGDDVVTILGISSARHFTILLQPYVQACQLHIHVLRADFSGIPITGFVTSFEGQINKQLQVNISNLPKGFLYCTTGVRTESSAMYITYSATPV